MRHHRLLGIAMFFLLAAILVVPGLIQGAQAKPVAGGGNGDGTGIVVVQSVALTADEVKWLKYLREEEKVARELEEKEKKERADRLRHAADKRRELGS